MLEPGRYRICGWCYCPSAMHDPQCPGFRSWGSAYLDARCIEDMQTEFETGRTAVPEHLRVSVQGTLI